MSHERLGLLAKLRLARRLPGVRDRYGSSKMCAVDKDGNWVPPLSKRVYRALQLAELLGFLLLLALGYLFWSVFRVPLLAWVCTVLALLISPTAGSFWSYERYLENYMTRDEYLQSQARLKALLANEEAGETRGGK